MTFPIFSLQFLSSFWKIFNRGGSTSIVRGACEFFCNKRMHGLTILENWLVMQIYKNLDCTSKRPSQIFKKKMLPKLNVLENVSMTFTSIKTFFTKKFKNPRICRRDMSFVSPYKKFQVDMLIIDWVIHKITSEKHAIRNGGLHLLLKKTDF